jgi:hypothetical protein
MNKAEDFLKQYANGKPIQIFIGNDGGELPNNIHHIASVMEAYKEHCIKSQKSDSLPPVSESFTRNDLLLFYKWYDSLPYDFKSDTVEVGKFLMGINEALDYWKSNVR